MKRRTLQEFRELCEEAQKKNPKTLKELEKEGKNWLTKEEYLIWKDVIKKRGGD